ncbi:MAG TPA: GntR family transcriptional regulator [Steroidobacteraceae bacterium]
MFILHPQSGIPIYRQIVEQVRRLVAAGQLTAGTELPSVREVALEHTVNFNTVSKAYGLLESEGLLVRHRGRPMTIAPQSRGASDVRRRGEQLAPQIEQLVFAAQQLDLDIEDLLILMRKKWSKSS